LQGRRLIVVLKHARAAVSTCLPRQAIAIAAIPGVLAMGRAVRIKLGMRRFARRHRWLTRAIRSFMIFSAVFGGACGFIAGSVSKNSGYSPHTFALGAWRGTDCRADDHRK
jgi:hypothetical protein